MKALLPFGIWVSIVITVAAMLDASSALAAVIVTDDLGRNVELARPVHRIVSLSPSVTETLFAVGAGDKLVGDTTYCDFPPAAKSLPHVGDTLHPSTEMLIGLKRDIVIIASETMSPSEADQLAVTWRSPVFIASKHTYQGVEDDVATFGKLFGEANRTRSTLFAMEQARLTVRLVIAGNSRPAAFVVVWDRPLMTASGASFIGDLIRLAGGINIAEKTPGKYPGYSLERLIQKDPPFIFVGDTGDTVRRSTLRLPGSSALSAARNHRVYGIPSSWTDIPGPRLRMGLLAIAQILHPASCAKVSRSAKNRL